MDLTLPFKDMPKVPKELWEQAKNIFSYYLFIKPRNGKNHREIVCSHCGMKKEVYSYLVPGQHENDLALYFTKHGDVVTCPECGKGLIVYDYNRPRHSLRQWHYSVFFIPVSFNKVWVRCFEMGFKYCDDAYRDKPESRYDVGQFFFYECDRYYLSKGEAYQWRCYNGLLSGWRCHMPFTDPFAEDSGLYHRREIYNEFLAQPLEETFLKYSQYTRFRRLANGYHEKWRYMAWYALHPMIEYLVKTDKVQGYRLVEDLIYRKPNKTIFNWDAEFIKDVWNLTREERDLWIINGGNLNALKKVMKLGRPSEDNWTAYHLLNKMRHIFTPDELRRIGKYCRKYGFPSRKLAYYLLKVEKENPGCTRCPSPDVFITWDDYMMNAEFLQYDLKEPVLFMPKNVFEAHDIAFRTADAIREEKEIDMMEGLTVRLKEKYSFEDDSFIIRVPHSMQEIIREGQLMKHCVKDYAEKHAKGKTVILFLRRKDAVGVPYVTIEMDGNRIRQRQAKGNTCPPKEALEFLKKWTDWLEMPKTKKKKEKEVRIA